jgi:hypothetical protein
MKGGYGYKIARHFLPLAEDKAKEMGTTMYTDDIPDEDHVIVSCDFSPKTPERRAYDNYLQLLYVKEKDQALVQ